MSEKIKRGVGKGKGNESELYIKGEGDLVPLQFHIT
jgi:hypothetical protein